MQLPATLGRYRVESLIGKGGMGEVYKAFDPSLDRTVALKTIASDAGNPEFLERLYREARACGKLHHPRIVTVYDLGEIERTVFIAMEYLEGESLAGAIARGRLSFEQKIEVLIQILDALDYAHGEGVIHRDVKPSNVHVMTDGSIKLLDFGLARVARADSLTMSGAVMGTPYYMSPEQIQGMPVDGRTDVYSTGVVAYELLTRRRVFDGEHISTVIMKVLSEAPQPMGTAWSSAFPEIERIVSRAIAKSVDDRYSTAAEMRDALAAFLASSRDAFAREQSEITVYVEKAVAEAKTLVASGRVAESEALLAATLAVNPDAEEARTLLRQATRGISEVNVPPARPQAAPWPGSMDRTVPAEPVARHEPVRPSPPAGFQQAVRAAAPPPLRAPAPVTLEMQPQMARNSRSTGRGLRWLGPAAAVIGIAIVAFAMVQRGMAPSGGGAGVAGASASAVATPPVRTQPAVATTAATPSSAALPATVTPSGVTPPVATSPNGRVAPAVGTAAPRPPAVANAATAQTPAPGGTLTAGDLAPRTPSQAPAAQAAAPAPRGASADAKAVYINAGNTDAALRADLAEAIKARELTLVAAPAGAHLEVSARTQVSVRPSAFAGNSALTADYVTTLMIRNRTTGASQTLQLDGHALDFGESVVRQAALRRAAEQVAEAIEMETGK